MKAKLANLTCLLAVVLVGCNINLPVGSRYVKSQAITAAQGGTITVTPAESPALAGTSLTIPPGALAADTTITLELSPESVAPVPSVGAGPVAVWGPAGTTFSQPVKMTLPYSLAADDAVEELFVQVVEDDGTTKAVEGQALTLDEGQALVSLEAGGFSRYQPCSRRCTADADCRAGRVCTNGRCRPPAPSCGNTTCAAGQVCVNQACVPACTQHAEVCDGVDNNCDGVVDEGCTTTCPAGLTSCDSASTNCVDLLSDPHHCGACGNACQFGTCTRGVCATPNPNDGGTPVTCAGTACLPGLTCCATPAAISCSDLLSDPHNCGACGAACPGGAACTRGICSTSTGDAGTPVTCGATSCAQGQVCCNSSCGICTPPGGACIQVVCCGPNNPCAAGQSCTNGSCQPQDAGTAPVRCTTSLDCRAPQTCVNGVCG